MRVDIAEALVDGGNAVRISGRLGFRKERSALLILRQHPLDECLRPARRFLRDMADLEPALDRNRAIVGRQIADDELEERGLASAIAPDEPDLVAQRNGAGGARQDRPALDAVSEFIDVQHGGRDSLSAPLLSPSTYPS
jgi:hypothetical protein